MKKEILSDVVKFGLAAAVIFSAMPDMAWADDLTKSVEKVKEGISDMPIVLSGLAYLAGGATMLHGAGLLKKHADNPQSLPLAAGVGRLAIGAVIAALPVAMQFVSSTLAQGENKLGFEAMSKIT